MYQVIDSRDRKLCVRIPSLMLARGLARVKNGYVLGPCTVCGHDALDEEPEKHYGALLCWHCERVRVG